MYSGTQSPTQLIQKGAIKSLVQKALTTASGSGGPLVPQHLEKLITNTIVQLVPEIAVIDPQYDSQKYHEFNRLTALPGGQGAMGEGATTPTSQSTYARTGRNLKVTRRKGAVTNFLQDASKNYIDALSQEMENHVQAHGYDLATQIVWGNDEADAYTFPGLDYFITTNRSAGTRGGTVPTDLSILDAMIDSNADRQGANHRKVFLMTNRMLSKFSGLLTNVRLNQGLSQGGLSTVSIPGGWRLQAYRDIPIVTTTRLKNDTAMGTVTAAKTDSGGSVAADTYYFNVSYVDINGESVADAERSVTPTGGSSVVTLSWTDVPSAWYYKIYCANATGVEKLVAVIPSKMYDSVGSPGTRVTTVTFSTTPTTRNPTVSAPADLASALSGKAPVTAAMANDLPIVQTGGVTPERIVFWDLDKIQGLGKFAYTNAGGSRFGGLVTMEPLAKTDDNNPFLTKTYGTLIDSWEATSAIAMNIRPY
jgi:hypothetical protein